MLIFFISAVVGLMALVYLLLLALTFTDLTGWFLVFCVLGCLTIGLGMGEKGTAAKVTAFVLAASMVLVVGAGIVFSPFIMSRNYAGVLGGLEKTDIEEYTPSIDTVPLMDQDTAELLMNRTLGTLVDEVSQFELGDSTQINYQGRAVRVAPLKYAGFFKYMNNRQSGIPAYVTVDMQTQKTEIHYLEQGMKYSPSAYFGKDLLRHIWLSYPTAIVSDNICFELDEEGNPLWVVPRLVHKVGFFGSDVRGVFCVNAVTGEINYYEAGNVPDYIDNVYPADLVIAQYDDYGKFSGGFWNSLIGQRRVTATTEGYNYIPDGDDIYLYTGVTSVNGDESNIGFIYVNLRTKEAKYFEQAGAEEFSAMASAEGMVQHLGYTSTFPLLLSIDGYPTYCVSLKDSGGLVKMYGLVNVEQYQIVVTGDSIAQCLQKYRASLRSNGQHLDKNDSCIEGVVTEILSANMDGSTYYYLQLDNKPVYYEVCISDNKEAVLLKEGCLVNLSLLGQPTKDSIQEAALNGWAHTVNLVIQPSSEAETNNT